tara:strand:- start:9745 stop:10824 length:1080 start_codon:yes stop_codon:yes gene_type:complete
MVNYNTYIGNKKSLKFPVMSDGYVSIPYNKNVATTPYGIWEISDSFTIQAIITPYDCNGNIRDTVLDSEKTISASPTSSNQSNHYLNNNLRLKHKMVLFQSENVELFLQNNTVNNANNPAHYSLGMRVKITNDDTIFTNNLIIPISNHTNLDDTDDMYDGFQKIRSRRFGGSGLATSSNSYDTFLPVSSTLALNQFIIGDLLYDINNTLIGEIKQIDTSGTKGLHLSGVYDVTPYNNSNFEIYVDPDKEPVYVLGNYHIAASFNNASGTMSLYLNGVLVNSKQHIDRKNNIITDFNFADGDIYIGQNPDATVPRQTQFMGEIHELSVNDDLITDFPSLYTLFPQRRTLKLYLTFEEGDN